MYTYCHILSLHDALPIYLRPSEAGTRTPDVQSDAHGDSPSLPICSTIVLDGSRRNEPILAPSEQIILARPPGGIVEPQPERGVIERRAAQDDEAVAILFFADRLHRAGAEHGRARLRRHGHDILLELALHARGQERRVLDTSDQPLNLLAFRLILPPRHDHRVHDILDHAKGPRDRTEEPTSEPQSP